ncbi:MAG: hypothetical protein PHU85_17255 [Phycisphaerae bacterium]|nr:hypothetical protein [Phycisphaerae bacterium]
MGIAASFRVASFAIALSFAAATFAADPASQPDGPGKLVAKLVCATAKPLVAGVPSEDWIVKEVTDLGLPVAIDLCGWTAVGGQATKLDTARLSPWTLTVAARRDAASELLMIDLAGTKKKSFMMLDKIGQRDVQKLDAMPDGRSIFIALDVVPLSFKPEALWGEAVNSIRVNLRIEPNDWPQKGTIKLLGLFENAGANQVQPPMWGMHTAVPLEIFNAKGQKIEPQTKASTKPNMGFWGGNSQLRPGGSRTASVTGEWADSGLTVTSSTGTTWTWKLPPGSYEARAIADFQDFPYRGMNPGATSNLVYSQRAAFRIGTPTTQGAGR